MRTFYFKRLGIIWRICLLNFDDNNVADKFPQELSPEEKPDLDLCFFRDEKRFIKEKASKGRMQV